MGNRCVAGSPSPRPSPSGREYLADAKSSYDFTVRAIRKGLKGRKRHKGRNHLDHGEWATFHARSDGWKGAYMLSAGDGRTGGNPPPKHVIELQSGERSSHTKTYARAGALETPGGGTGP